MRTLKTLLIACCVFASSAVLAQSSFLPRNLGPSVNSPYDELNPVVSADGKMLYFVRANHPDNTYGLGDSEDIWVSTRVNDSTWTAATRIPDLNIGRYNAVLSVSADGGSLLINGIYDRAGTIWRKRGLSVVTRSGEGWSTPERLRVKKLTHKNRGMRSSGSMSADGKAIVLSYTKVYNGERNNLYVSVKKENGKWRKPRKLKTLNSFLNEQTPFLSADGKTIFFSSDRDSKGMFNIYKATRLGDGWKDWTDPQLLSDTINSSGWESYFKTNEKGSRAFFSSTNKSLGQADIFTVKLFEENPFVIVSGSVVNSQSSQILRGRPFTVLVNGTRADSVKIDREAGTYEVKLPLGRSYRLSAAVDNYTSSSQVIDLTRQREFGRRKSDLPVTPLPYVQLTGRIIVRDSGKPVESMFHPQVLVNNRVIDSLVIDPATSTYKVRLGHGRSYGLRAQADKHEPVPAMLDLSSSVEYEEMTMDLYLDEEKMAIVSGRILDKKTGKPLAKLVHATIRVEGVSSVIAAVDTVNATYELRLPYGTIYTISAAAPKYYALYENVDLTTKTEDVRITKDLVIVPVEVGASIRLNNIFFDAGKTVLKPESYPELDRVAEFLQSNPEIKIEISGHTDNSGKSATNLKLSQSRANAVATYVIKKGIDKNRIVSKGYGSAKPVGSNKTKEGKAQNRRVEFMILAD